jgi:hypothetical protein
MDPEIKNGKRKKKTQHDMPKQYAKSLQRHAKIYILEKKMIECPCKSG